MLRIAIVNNAELDNADHWVPCSVRMTRAIRKARQLKVSNHNVMLFSIDEQGNRHPVSLRKPRYNPPKGFGVNSHSVGGWFEDGKSSQQAALELDRIARQVY